MQTSESEIVTISKEDVYREADEKESVKSDSCQNIPSHVESLQKMEKMGINHPLL